MFANAACGETLFLGFSGLGDVSNADVDGVKLVLLVDCEILPFDETVYDSVYYS